MSAVVTLPAPAEAKTQVRRRSLPAARELAPLLFAIVNSIGFVIVRPDVSDLQAALAREYAADQGVGLDYWFQWFGGGTTPGHYSVLSPYLSSWLGAPLAGALGTIALTPLTYRACANTRFQMFATWIGTVGAALSLWSGRVPFALGSAAAVIGVIGVRERRRWLAYAGAIAASLFSPVTGAFLAFVLLGVFISEIDFRRLATETGLVCGATLLFVAFYFGTPGTEPYTLWRALLASATAACLLLAKPNRLVRTLIWLTIIASPILSIIPNGMGSNFVRMPYICLPPAVIAVATSRRALAFAAVVPALVSTAEFTTADLILATRPAADAAYYASLGRELDGLDDVKDFRVEVVQNTAFHTAAVALLNHAALASGWETQQQRSLNGVLTTSGLNATSYKVWLDNNAVGYVAFDHRSPGGSYEYNLVKTGDLPYLTQVWQDKTWRLYKVEYRTPIVPPPQQVVTATQSKLTISVNCACTFNVRVRYSKFLTATETRSKTSAVVQDDLTGWTTITTPKPGTYVLQGQLRI